MRMIWGKKAFTLIELIFVVVIVGILATLAAPRFFHTVEKSRIAEATQILETLRNAQEVYKLEHDGAYAAALTDLDVDVTTSPSRNFGLPEVFDSPEPLASIERDAGGYQYTLSIDTDGTVRCGGTVSPTGICARLGCPSGVCN